MECIKWTDERLDERVNAMDQTFDRIYDELRGLRSDFAAMQDRLVQIGFGLVFVLVGAMVALIVAVA